MHLEAAVLFSHDQHIPALPVGYPYGADAGLRQLLYAGLRFPSGQYQACGHKGSYDPDEEQIKELIH
jgi:hypothetical protein